ncbi:30S ribosomal protein S5 [Babesia sp. Xinjiang]|uniref:30S ribosomal protein S5 n=1 Tax=Babesia sp. Xinjiang TaxID=462227 RepID=UPI000A25A999|nr:30S ribosomal protein S5 [Babesia sp. Xinjiang]ORM40396.1 30S ribosomal protein S5 [Babesia sp. Xinjiang]
MIRSSLLLLAARGHVQRVLRRQRAPFHQRYDRLLGDQRERVASALRNVRYEKCAVAKELSEAHRELASLCNPERAPRSSEEEASLNRESTNSPSDSRTDVNEGYRLYRLLRPEAPNFFEEQSFISLKQRMDTAIKEHQTENFKELVPLNISLDGLSDGEAAFSDETYASAMYALMDSITADIALFCESVGVDREPEDHTDPFDRLGRFLALKRDGSNVGHWADCVWPRVKPFLAPEFGCIDSKDVARWLAGHLERVQHNRAVTGRPESSEWYDIKRDLAYDGMPYPEGLLDERRVGYPLDRAGEYLYMMLQLFNPSLVDGVSKASLDKLIEALRRIGLKDWFGLRGRDITATFFGATSSGESGRAINVSEAESHPDISFTKSASSACVSLLSLFASGNDHVLEEEYWSPSSAFFRGGIPGPPGVSAVDSPVLILASESPLSRCDLESIVNTYASRLSTVSGEQAVRDCNRVFDRMIKEELEFHASVGAGTVGDDGINYKVPAGAQFDAKRNYYVRTREGVDPTLKLENLRSCVLERRRMRTMTKEGRVYFLRVVVAVGDGRGYFGIGVGFGNDVGTARASAVQQALRNMYFIDFDPKEPLTTPVLGQEYGCRVYITPRKMGSGIKTNRKYLPLVYLIGLDNCKVTFHGRKSWITRAKALRKALEQIYSRRTMCNATGMRYVYVGSPGDHTVHWPDNWFIPIAKEYKSKLQQLKNLKRIHFRRHTRRVVLPEEVSPEVPSYASHKFRSPLEVLEQERKRTQWISTTVPKVSPPPTTESLSQHVE